MVKNLIDNITKGVTSRVTQIVVLLIACMLILVSLVSGMSINRVYQSRVDSNEKLLSNLISQQSSSPAGLISVYVYDENHNILDVRGEKLDNSIPILSGSEVSNIYTQKELYTFKNVVKDSGSEVRVYKVLHNMDPLVAENFTVSATNVYYNKSVLNPQGLDYNIAIDITNYLIMALFVIAAPIIISIVLNKSIKSTIITTVNKDIVPTLVYINDCAMDVSEGKFDTYIQNGSDVELLDVMIKSFNSMFTVISDEINKYKAVAMQASADSENQVHGLANISHEIRTPLNAIYNLSRLIDKNTKAEDLYRNLEDIQNSSMYLLKLINDFLDISKAGADEMILDESGCDIRELFQSCQIMMQGKADEKGINLMCHVEPPDGRLVICDATKLKQILINILSNSLKFTHKGDVSLITKITKRDKTKVTMRFTIKDTGVGMTSTQLENLFTPYQQADAHTQRRYGGTGLGMTISRKIIELMGSVLEVESLEGVGTKMCFNLTFETEPASEDANLNISRTLVVRDEPPWYGLTALVFEDNKTNQRILETHLKAIGITSILTEDGFPGIKIYNERSKQIDVIFMDMNMIEMDGSEATQRLRELGCTVPIILITAMTINNFDSIYKPKGFSAMIEKTFDKEVLWALMDRYFPEKAKTVEDKILLSGDKELLDAALFDLKDSEIKLRTAYDEGDLNTAFKICHSIKGVASVIGAGQLSSQAKILEDKFKNSSHVEDKVLTAFCNELVKVVNKLKPAPVSQEVYVLLDTVKSLLDLSDMGVVGYIPKLQKIKDTDTLISHINSYDFSSASSEIELLMIRL